MKVPQLRIATRRSLLARTQSEWVASLLVAAHPGLEVALVEVTSSGDADQVSPVTALPEIGAFTKALQDAVLAGRADCAVHSLKDLPTETPAGLALAAVPPREDPRDVLVSGGRSLAALPAGAVVGTGSPRREQQLLERRPDLEVAAIRGNVDTRIRKVFDGEVDAVVLALAGVRRISRDAAVTEILDFVPAPGQGALAVECRAADAAVRTLLAAVHDADAGDCVAAERAWLAATGAGCRTSAAALATLTSDGARIDLTWFLEGASGRGHGLRADPEAIGRSAAEGAP